MGGVGMVNVDIGSIMSGAGQLLKDIRTAWTGKNPELEAKLIELQLQFDSARDTAQSEINKIEAGSSKFFVSGWRPCVGWVCASAFALTYFLFPLINYVAAFFGKTIPMPPLNMEELGTLLLGMLGLGGMRTWEKYKGIATK